MDERNWEIWKSLDKEGATLDWILTEGRDATNVRKVESALAGRETQLTARLFGVTEDHAKAIMAILQLGSDFTIATIIEQND